METVLKLPFGSPRTAFHLSWGGILCLHFRRSKLQFLIASASSPSNVLVIGKVAYLPVHLTAGHWKSLWQWMFTFIYVTSECLTIDFVYANKTLQRYIHGLELNLLNEFLYLKSEMHRFQLFCVIMIHTNFSWLKQILLMIQFLK